MDRVVLRRRGLLRVRTAGNTHPILPNAKPLFFGGKLGGTVLGNSRGEEVSGPILQLGESRLQQLDSDVSTRVIDAAEEVLRGEWIGRLENVEFVHSVDENHNAAIQQAKLRKLPRFLR